jgi:hypothetical protein
MSDVKGVPEIRINHVKTGAIMAVPKNTLF